jgi:hypothetical protein
MVHAEVPDAMKEQMAKAMQVFNSRYQSWCCWNSGKKLLFRRPNWDSCMS